LISWCIAEHTRNIPQGGSISFKRSSSLVTVSLEEKHPDSKKKKRKKERMKETS